MIAELQLSNFRAFTAYRVQFRKENVLVGPNSAGKSTLLMALRFARTCVRQAYRVKPSEARQHRGSWIQSYPAPIRNFKVLRESVRHEFRDSEEASLTLRWKNGASITVVWPATSEEDEAPYFYLRNTIGNNPRNIAQVRAEFHDIASIPALSTLEHEEEVLDSEYVRQHLDSHRASRHFRNQLLQLANTGLWGEFCEFAAPWMGGFELSEPTVAYAIGGEPGIDLFYREPGSSKEKEVVWAGDGFQIWLQLLLHLYRNRREQTVLLDEPEVFLHPDLQRRLMRVLTSLDQQFLFATHSAEVLAEVDRSSILWIDKTRKRAIRNPQSESLEAMSSHLGSSFNLALAKALRARGVLFVEGEDVRLLRSLSATAGMPSITAETRLAVVPIEGFSNWQRAEYFGWIAQEFLNNAVSGLLIVDRDYRTESQVQEIEDRVRQTGITVHTWSRKEVESYLLNAETISRLSKCPVDEVTFLLEQATAAEEQQCFTQLTAHLLQSENKSKKSAATLMKESQDKFTKNWPDPEYRIRIAPPKSVLATVNQGLQARGHKAASFTAIAKHMRLSEIDREMLYVLERIEDLAK
ncbi:AAA family ATPase [Micromonospora sp. DSM 115977]|uniref:AAA family ATPase n=1 Tax=Micromonospora reichwaldensis TaxID=3075516 RepID=A0ABU2X4D8_9ACTN|nr:AAA family ATPase [Micromonospora sp. DSM 115977]MDT0532625.1 AAA family ATPase [Micromonospora sp. DSM 115977]